MTRDLRAALEALETSATVVVSNLPDGEYAGLGSLRMSLRDAREALAASPVTAPAPATAREVECKAILSLMGNEPYLGKGHVENGEFRWTIVADKISVQELLVVRPATLVCKCVPITVEAGDGAWADTDTIKCEIHGGPSQPETEPSTFDQRWHSEGICQGCLDPSKKAILICADCIRTTSLEARKRERNAVLKEAAEVADLQNFSKNTGQGAADYIAKQIRALRRCPKHNAMSCPECGVSGTTRPAKESDAK